MFKFFTGSTIIGLSLSAAAAATPLPEVLSLGGHDYQLELRSNERLGGKLRGARYDAGQHFRGRLKDVPNSWVRMSLVNGEWSGLASFGEQAYLLGESPRRSEAQFSSATNLSVSSPSINASPVDQLPHTQCGSNKHPHSAESMFSESSQSTLRAHSVFEQPKIARADLSELCATMVDGVCMLAEVEFVFDQLFQSRLSDPQATANSIINIVEGYYSESFNIEFDVISTEFLSTEVFTSSTDPDVLLGGTDAMHPVEDPASIRAMSANDELPFEVSKPALLHLITGRNFDGGTAGIAFTDVLCNSNGFASATSQLIGVGSGNEASITAMIVAHEMGHNFGANHDSLDNSCSTGFLMEASLSVSTAGFSSCSESEIDAAIDSLPSLGQCFNFPADVSISADSANPSEASTGVEFSNQFDIVLEEASEAIPLLSVQGNVSDGSGSFTAVLLNGAACSLGTGNQSYSCSENSPGASATLEVSAIGNSSSVSFQHSANFAGSNELIETDSSNNSVSATVSFTGDAPAPIPDPDPAPQENPAPTPDPTGNPEPNQTGNPAPASSGSGGGGAAGAGSLIFLLITSLFARARRRADASLALPAFVMLFSACSQVPSLSAAPKEDGSYTVIQQRSCYCMEEFRRPIKMWVEDGSVVNARYSDDGSQVSDAVKSQLRSLEQWQKAIEQWRQQQPNKLEVAYEGLSKTLSRFDFDPSAMKSDDEFSLTFTNYQTH